MPVRSLSPTFLDVFVHSALLFQSVFFYIFQWDKMIRCHIGMCGQESDKRRCKLKICWSIFQHGVQEHLGLKHWHCDCLSPLVKHGRHCHIHCKNVIHWQYTDVNLLLKSWHFYGFREVSFLTSSMTANFGWFIWAIWDTKLLWDSITPFGQRWKQDWKGT